MKRIILAGAALLALAAAAPALADNVNGASADGTAAVTIYTPITVTQTQGLDFGTITSGADGSVAIDPDSGARNVNGGVGAVAANVGQQGAFLVTGQSNAAINVVVGSDIKGFAGGISGVTKVSSLPTVLKDTSASFAVGGSLKIPAQTKAGKYSGTYTVAVNYP
jgi:hypothetical protein